jgi:hypothetical protein
VISAMILQFWQPAKSCDMYLTSLVVSKYRSWQDTDDGVLFCASIDNGKNSLVLSHDIHPQYLVDGCIQLKMRTALSPPSST